MIIVRELWRRAFLDERPSISLSLFRIAVAVTVGCHLLPSLLELSDNYLAVAFKEKNLSFFPLWALRLVEASPDWLVVAVVGLFAASWFFFLIGFRTQPSAIVMTLGCYYFYALNSLHIGTLSFDILLVTLSLVWVTPYPGDWLSVDSLIRGDPAAYRRMRPFFIQRLLQLQIAWMFWYTALSKFTAGGNWLTDTPYYYLMHYPPMGVVREFPFREVLARHPGWCAGIGYGVIVSEVAMPVLWFIRRTRPAGLALGILFQALLLVTLHVPTIFFFLFPPQMLLFVEPERLVAWIERQRQRAAERVRPTEPALSLPATEPALSSPARECRRPMGYRPRKCRAPLGARPTEPVPSLPARKCRAPLGARPLLLYDGGCGFCQASVRRLALLDVFGAIERQDFHAVAELQRLHPDLTPQRCHSRMQLVEPDGRLSEGFFAFRRISRRLPVLWPLVPALYLPGVGWVGQRVYDWVAARRFLFHASRTCSENRCGIDTHSPKI